jgi:hypothetical protein
MRRNVCVATEELITKPFNSMYFAVQAMAAELSTGALVMYQIQKSGKKISMLVANNKGNFKKKRQEE